MNLGFIGTGKIAASVITGICKSKISYKKIIISPRNKKIALGLKRKFKKIVIAKNNQQIVDQSNWVFLSVTPIVGEKIIKDLKFKSTQTVVSFISTITLSQDAVVNSKEDLKRLVKESQTSKGLNEQGVKELTKAGFYKSLERTLNSIHRRLNK